MRRSHQSQSPKFGDEDATSLITTCNVPILLIVSIQHPELLYVLIMSAPSSYNLAPIWQLQLAVGQEAAEVHTCSATKTSVQYQRYTSHSSAHHARSP